MGILPQSTSGIYQIKNTINGHLYIGSSIAMNKRWTEHIRMLRKNEHDNIHLQRAFNKYGEEHFIFSILELCFPFALIDREQYYIDKFKPEYNICQRAYSRLGQINSPETCAKISQANMGRINSPEIIAKRYRPVIQYTMGLVFIAEYESVKAAQQATGAFGISDVCNNKRNSAGGYIWRYKYRNYPHNDGPERNTK